MNAAGFRSASTAGSALRVIPITRLRWRSTPGRGGMVGSTLCARVRQKCTLRGNSLFCSRNRSASSAVTRWRTWRRNIWYAASERSTLIHCMFWNASRSSSWRGVTRPEAPASMMRVVMSACSSAVPRRRNWYPMSRLTFALSRPETFRQPSTMRCRNSMR